MVIREGWHDGEGSGSGGRWLQGREGRGERPQPSGSGLGCGGKAARGRAPRWSPAYVTFMLAMSCVCHIMAWHKPPGGSVITYPRCCLHCHQSLTWCAGAVGASGFCPVDQANREAEARAGHPVTFGGDHTCACTCCCACALDSLSKPGEGFWRVPGTEPLGRV